ncbi:hypothetical protein [Desulfosporosinus metallidurans]|uniref:Uncharacterized protein n=1 Tax=Desulfosporosinus metallidurans TaxID=1888891 RepID=A0A1Q8QEH6_9FIRM|nr:hypothetical protein [Desulfosporosinus metallidurans]OLN25736.1 hypothetical protein DSOL_5242 [Desulfosporosinus metallidurans]
MANSPATATQQATIVTVNAANHIESLGRSGLKEPGALISVNSLGGLNIRYRVDLFGHGIELPHYGSVN